MALFAKETYNFMEPTSRSQSITEKLCVELSLWYTNKHTQTHTHTHTYIYTAHTRERQHMRHTRVCRHVTHTHDLLWGGYDE